MVGRLRGQGGRSKAESSSGVRFFLPPPFLPLLSLGQALLVGIPQLGEKLRPVCHLKGIAGRAPLSPQKPMLESSILFSLFLYFTSPWTSLPSSLPSLRPTQWVSEEASAHVSPSSPAALLGPPPSLFWNTSIIIFRVSLLPLLAL